MENNKYLQEILYIPKAWGIHKGLIEGAKNTGDPRGALHAVSDKLLDMALDMIDYEDWVIPKWVSKQKERTYIEIDKSFVSFRNILDDVDIQGYNYDPDVYTSQEIEANKKAALEALIDAIKEQASIEYKRFYFESLEEVLKTFRKDPFIDVVINDQSFCEDCIYEGRVYIRNSDNTVNEYEYYGNLDIEGCCNKSNSISKLLDKYGSHFEFVRTIYLYETDGRTILGSRGI